MFMYGNSLSAFKIVVDDILKYTFFYFIKKLRPYFSYRMSSATVLNGASRVNVWQFC